MKKRMNNLMKYGVLSLLVCALLMLCGCGREENAVTQTSGKEIHIEQSAYYYEQGYKRSGGWLYEITIASDHQISELEKLTDALTLQWTGEDFYAGQGYRIIWKDAAGEITREMLLLDAQTVSMEGILYEVQNGQPLLGWIEALHIAEQSVE